MTLTTNTLTRRDLAESLPVLSSYVSLVWAMRFTAVALAVWAVVALGGAGMWTVIGLACPMICLFLLLGTIVAVVASQVTPDLPEDTLPVRLQLLGGIIASSARHALTGIPRNRAK